MKAVRQVYLRDSIHDSGVKTPISAPEGLKLIENDQFQANIAVYQYNAEHCTASNAAIWHQIGSFSGSYVRIIHVSRINPYPFERSIH